MSMSNKRWRWCRIKESKYILLNWEYKILFTKVTIFHREDDTLSQPNSNLIDFDLVEKPLPMRWVLLWIGRHCDGKVRSIEHKKYRHIYGITKNPNQKLVTMVQNMCPSCTDRAQTSIEPLSQDEIEELKNKLERCFVELGLKHTTFTIDLICYNNTSQQMIDNITHFLCLLSHRVFSMPKVVSCFFGIRRNRFLNLNL